METFTSFSDSTYVNGNTLKNNFIFENSTLRNRTSETRNKALAFMSIQRKLNVDPVEVLTRFQKSPRKIEFALKSIYYKFDTFFS